MEKKKYTILRDVINNRKIETDLELRFNIDLLYNKSKKVKKILNSMSSNSYFYEEHLEFLEDYRANGELRFKEQYIQFCKKIYAKKGEEISDVELKNVIKSNKFRLDFKKYLIDKTNKKIKKLKKLFGEFENDEKYFQMKKKLVEMKELKRDIEYDIAEISKKINPTIFSDLEQRVSEYTRITARNELFFSALFDETIVVLDDTNAILLEQEGNKSEKIEELDAQLSILYIAYYDCLDNYIEKSFILSYCEDYIKFIKREAENLKEKVEELCDEKKS